MPRKQFYVYILANRTRRLYTGMTGDLQRRIWQHRMGVDPGFTRRYGITRLVYYEVSGNPLSAIAREKQIKGWLRRKKIELIEEVNPAWKDLSEGWLR